MAQKSYTVGDLAEITGLTIRSLQHYDNIGLVPASGRTKGGRRFYTKSDLMHLEQVIFYKALGFSLKDISEKLIKTTDANTLKDILIHQEYLLLRKMDNLHTTFTAIEASLLVLESGKEPSSHQLLQAMSALPKEDIWEIAPDTLTEKQHDSLDQYFSNFNSAQSFYHCWKECVMKASALRNAGVSIQKDTAQRLAMEWISLMKPLSDVDASEFQSIRKGWADKGILLDEAELAKAHEYISDAVAFIEMKEEIHD